MISIKGRAVEIEATSGAVLGPPWQQAENGYLVGPAPVNGKEGELRKDAWVGVLLGCLFGGRAGWSTGWSAGRSASRLAG